jgi:hypothetical protein
MNWPPIDLQQILLLIACGSFGFFVFPIMIYAREKRFKKMTKQLRQQGHNLTGMKTVAGLARHPKQRAIYLGLALLLLLPLPFCIYFGRQTLEVWQEGERYRGKVSSVKTHRRGKTTKYKTGVKWPSGKIKTYHIKSRYKTGDPITLIWHQSYPKKVYSDQPRDWFDFYLMFFLGLIFAPLLWIVLGPLYRGFNFQVDRKIDGQVIASETANIRNGKMSYMIVEVHDPYTQQPHYLQVETHHKKVTTQVGDTLEVLYQRRGPQFAVENNTQLALKT